MGGRRAVRRVKGSGGSATKGAGAPRSSDGYLLDAVADAPDVRDRMYEPALVPLRPVVPPPPELEILDQGREGACTGFGLAAVINLLHREQGTDRRVSPRMLYEMARRFDEWPGVDYSGSSCRGAIRGWHNMGVCSEGAWKYEAEDASILTLERAEDAKKNTIGAYYRIRRVISEVHAALNEVGAIYVSADVHEGWQGNAPRGGEIPFRKEKIGGHAFAVVGYNERGFWVQNSWGAGWGQTGLALWTYEDWLVNVRDAWVVRLALPTPQIFGRTATSYIPASDGLSQDQSTARRDIAGHFVHLDDGSFDDNGQYWSNLDDVKVTADNLVSSQKYPHLLFYGHGGLNDTKASARRISAMKDVFKANDIYPFHFMYDTGLLEEIKDVLLGKRRETVDRVGNMLAEAGDRAIEYAARRPGRALWREMKRDARVPFDDNRAGSQLAEAFADAMRGRRVHVVGHSTGAVLMGHFLAACARLGVVRRIASCSLMAPACSVEFGRSQYEPHLRAPAGAFGIDRMRVYNLTDTLERNDSVGPYRKSLLYLVSRAFEDVRRTPLLGMELFSDEIQKTRRGLPKLSFEYSVGRRTDANPRTQSETHGGFDNDEATMNDILETVLGRKPERPFEKGDLQY